MKKFILFLLLNAALFSVDTIPPDVPSGKTSGVKVAILGDSRGEPTDKKGFNEYVLGRLFSLIKRDNPQAVFFTGDLVLGLGESKDVPESESSVSAPEKDLYGNRWKKKDLVYSPTIYAKQLANFSQLYQSKLGKIPFYSVLGFYESLGPNSFNIFNKQFNLQTQQVGNHLVYSVPIGNAYFILVTTTYYNPTHKHVEEHYISQPLLDWLSKELKEKAANYPFVFVLGHEPAYSTTSASGYMSGLDSNDPMRDQFWKILQDNNVTAYISGREHLYDRSDRNGVWQIITGGAGAPLTQRNLEKAFYHYLLLTIPDDADNNPSLKVIDANGNIRDEFELKSNRKPIYQLRISERDRLER